MDQVPPQLKGVVEQAMRAASDGKLDGTELAAIREAAIAAGAKGVAFQESTTTSWAPTDDGSIEHLGPPPPGPPPAAPA